MLSKGEHVKLKVDRRNVADQLVGAVRDVGGLIGDEKNSFRDAAMGLGKL